MCLKLIQKHQNNFCHVKPTTKTLAHEESSSCDEIPKKKGILKSNSNAEKTSYFEGKIPNTEKT